MWPRGQQRKMQQLATRYTDKINEKNDVITVKIDCYYLAVIK